MKEYENAAKIFNTHAKLYEQKYMDVSRYVFGIQRFLVGMKMNAHVLELGCGPGNLTKMIHEFRPDLHITGIDLAPDMIKLAQKNVPSGNFQVMNALNIDQLNQKFDGIVCGFVLPYLNKIESSELFQKAAKLLNPNGKIYLSCIKDSHANSGKTQGSTKDSIYQYFYELQDLEEMLLSSNFKITFDNAISYSDAKGEVVNELELVVSAIIRI